MPLQKGAKNIAKKMKQRDEENSDYFKVKDGGKATIRFITDIDSCYGHESHFVGPDKKNTTRMTCRKEVGVCPACESSDPDIRRSAYQVWYLVYHIEAKRVKFWTANKTTHESIVEKADIYGTLTNRDFVITGKTASKGTQYEHIKYSLSALDKSKAKKIDVPLDIETQLKSMEVSEEQMVDAMAGKQVKDK